MTDKPLLPVVAWRAEWNGDDSDLGAWVYVEEPDELDHEHAWQTLTDHAAATEALTQSQERIEALERDARRYRWIRDHAKGEPGAAEFWPAVRLALENADDLRWCDSVLDCLTLDAAIDAALSPSEPGA